MDGTAKRRGLRELDEAVARVLDSGWFILGPEGEAFERELAEALGARDAVASRVGHTPGHPGPQQLRDRLLACALLPQRVCIEAGEEDEEESDHGPFAAAAGVRRE